MLKHDRYSVRRFNPRPRAGGDLTGRGSTRQRSCFNPRPRAGGDLCFVNLTRFTPCFNPRPRAGGDRSRHILSLAELAVSIHAPAREATCAAYPNPAYRDGFNPRPRAGGDNCPCILDYFIGSFNPRPRAGGDRYHLTDSN